MKRRWLAALLALLMVMGTVGMAAAEEDDADEEKLEGQGPPAHIQDMLEKKAELKGDENDDEDDEGQGPPEFVRLMLEQKFSVMNKNKLMIYGNSFVSDLPPVIKEGRTLIPVGAVVRGLGADDVIWDADDRTITIIKLNEEGKVDIEIVLTVDDPTYTVYKNGSKVGEVFEMDTEAQILGNRTFVPLKFIAVALGEEVKWDPETGIINVGRALGQERAAEARMNEENDDKDENDDNVIDIDLESDDKDDKDEDDEEDED